ncbi:MAG: protein kinase [Candidatus Sumerlaeia bacterium]|nr:protein kinase [Candidatus Sumerlaeia bacterium]
MKPVAFCFIGERGKPVTKVFTEPSISIGRSRDNKLCFPSTQTDLLSRYHAVLEWVGEDELRLTDLGSLNGTHLNGVLVAEAVSLQPGDNIVIGRDITLQVHWKRDSPSPKRPANVSQLLFPLCFEEELRREFDTFEKYAEGAHGSIWRASGPGLKGWRVIKTLHTESEYQEGDTSLQRRLERFRREGEILGSFARTSGVYVVRAHQTGISTTGITYIVMDYVDGVTLRDMILDEHPIDIHSILGWFYDIAHTIKCAHEYNYTDQESGKTSRGIIHRDVRPSNILIENISNHALLCDFGIAAFEEGGARLTHSQDMVSHLHHTPPETFFNRSIGVNYDLWGLAVSFYLAVSGMVFPYEGRRPQELEDNIRRGKLRKLETHRGDIPPHVVTLATDSLAFAPENRPLIGDWVETLKPWAREPSGTARVRARR